MVQRYQEGYYPGLRNAGNCSGYCYFCKHCGYIWFKLDFGTPDSPGVNGREYYCVNSPCREHGTRYYHGGRIIDPLGWWEYAGVKAAYEKLPAELLAFELESYINHLERFG